MERSGIKSRLQPFLKFAKKLVLGKEANEGTELMWRLPIRADGLCELTREPVPNADTLRSVDAGEDGFVVIESGATSIACPVSSGGNSLSIDTNSSSTNGVGSSMTDGDRGSGSHEALAIQLDMSYDAIDRKEILGFGAFGQVFSADMDGKEVAVKMLPPHLDGLDEVKEGLRRELTLLVRVGQHPNVVKCLGGSVLGPHLFIVSELKKGGTLGDLIHRGGPNRKPQKLPVRRALQIIEDILRGLDHLHSLTPMVVHRDLKPDNVLLDEEDRACVADFGLSRCKPKTYVQPTDPGAGTTPYLGPEAMGGKLNEKMDIYSVGVIFWECLTALRPWRDFDLRAVPYWVHRGHRLDFPSDVFPVDKKSDEISDLLMGEVREMIERCWEQKPEDRPSCKDLLQDIEGLRKRFASLLG
ncbi:hypothetical protein BSKO_10209 [Bryopsis sp. KO-2023]|nr:hypothetical protein BSKO_10209 [Bryopsis sp. KO-2023]